MSHRHRPLRGVVRTVNAAASWLVTAGIALLGVEYLPAVGPVWSGLAGFVVVVALLPAVAHRSPMRVAPWPLLLLTALPLVTRTFGFGVFSPMEAVVTRPGFATLAGTVDGLSATAFISLSGGALGALLTEFADTTALASLALLVVAELQLFSPLRMSVRFGMFFVVVATMGLTGAWAVVRWLADRYFQTGFVATTDALMWEFAVATVAGILVAALFGPYFCQPRPDRQPTQVTGQVEGDVV